MTTRPRPNWGFITAVLLCFAGPALFSLTPYDPRPVSALVGMAAFVLLCWRFAEHYAETPTSTRVALALIGVSLLLGAVGSAQLASRHSALTVVTYPLFGHRIACLLFMVYLPRILALDTKNPWVTRPE